MSSRTKERQHDSDASEPSAAEKENDAPRPSFPTPQKTILTLDYGGVKATGEITASDPILELHSSCQTMPGTYACVVL